MNTISRLLRLSAVFDETLQFAADHRPLRALTGSPYASALVAQPGKKKDAYVMQGKHLAGQSAKGAALGAAIGAGSLASLGAGAKAAFRRTNKAKFAWNLAKLGAVTGGLAGLGVGALKGNYDNESDRIHRKFQ